MIRDRQVMKILDGEIPRGARVRIDADRNSKPIALRTNGPRSHGLTTCDAANCASRSISHWNWVPRVSLSIPWKARISAKIPSVELPHYAELRE